MSKLLIFKQLNVTFIYLVHVTFSIRSLHLELFDLKCNILISCSELVCYPSK